MTKMDYKKQFQEELDQLERNGLKRNLPGQEKAWKNLSSNDYLGLSRDNRVLEKTRQAIDDYSVGGTSSRLLAGTFHCHQELEKKIAEFLGKEKALVYSSGYHTNTGVLPVLAGVGDMVFVDRLCHASILDGIRLSQARFCTFDHNNVDHLESLLRKRRPQYRRAFIVTEGLFSMDGDESILPEIIYLAKKWEAMVYLDEAHSLGVIGPEGRGLAAQKELLKDVDVFVGTLSKTIGSQGGFVACQKEAADLLVSRSRSFIYTTALSPLCAISALTALELLPLVENRRIILQSEAKRLRTFLKIEGYDILESESQIIPVWTGEVEATKKLSEYLLSLGFFVPSIRPPTVPEGECRVRLSITYDIAKKGLDQLIKVFSTYPERPRREGKKIGQTA